ncbi:hypothetical protein FLONG3_8712 [Fusarium longipes]|uniref:Myb-like domain-containing protein n=1 Tax=Fusarium longipes TaxID=694270 RepID=A0A395S376_9HYPO|nr:hypothetical protein FLONG3_8712 [Fusarium longipes]
MNNKNWNDRADKDLFFTILSVKNIGVISGSEWTTIGNHMRSLGYGFTNEGCRQHFQGLRRAQNKTETTGPNGDTVRRNDPTMNPITRRPGPGRGRPRKQPPAPAEGAPHPPLAPGIVPGPPPNSAPPYSQDAQPYGPTPADRQPAHLQPAHAVMRPDGISSAQPASQAPPPGNMAHGPGAVTYPSPPSASALPHNSPHLPPLQHGPSVQPEQQSQSGQQPQPDQAQSAQQSQPDQQPQPTTQPQLEQEAQSSYQSQELQQEPPQGTQEATDTSVASQPQLQPQPEAADHGHEPHALLSQEQLQSQNEDIDADGDADGEADVDNGEPSAKRQRMNSSEPPKGDDMDDEAVLALAAHNGSTDFASDFATYGEA